MSIEAFLNVVGWYANFSLCYICKLFCHNKKEVYSLQTCINRLDFLTVGRGTIILPMVVNSRS